MKHMYRIIAVVGIVLVALFVMHDIAEARGGRSFGGSRRSFSRPKSGGGLFSKPRRQTSPLSKRQQTSPLSQRQQTSTSRPRTSFGGTRLSSGQDYRKSYGTPRKSEPVRMAGQTAGSPRYVAHYYGGMGDRFMTGYMMGATSMWWYTPFHPAFYYSRPYIVHNTDGTQEVYPPTFSFSKVLLAIVIIGGIAFVVYVIVRNVRRKKQVAYTSSFS